MVALALVAGIGTSLFTPAVLSGLPSLVDDDRAPAATSLFGAVNSIGMTAGPALGGALLLVATPTVLLAANGATFFLSAAVVAGLRFGARPDRPEGEEPASLLAETRAGLAIAAGMPVVRVLLWSSSAVILFAGMMNVAEPILATDVLESGGTGFSILVAVYGLGTFCGSLLTARGRTRSYCAGLLTLAAGLVVSGIAPSYPVALAGFAATGAGNGMLLVSQQVLIQESVPDRAMGRVFGLLDAAGAAAFAVALLAAGGIVATLGARAVFIGAGLTGLMVCAAVWRLLSSTSSQASGAGPAEPAPAV
jgi:MFS family permease